MSLLIVFSGQGNQHKKMFNLLKSNETGKAWLSQASQLLHKNLLDENIVELYCDDIIYSQLFISLLSIGTFRLIKQNCSFDYLLSGYSLGEISAFSVSTNLSIEEICRLVEMRARLMYEAMMAATEGDPAGLGVLKGNLSFTELENLVDKHQCYIAIINGEDHIIVGGLLKQLETLLIDAKRHGVMKAELLKVRLPSHTPLLKKATEGFSDYLKQFQNRDMNCPILNALTAEIINTTSEFLPILANELSQTLDWYKLMQISGEYGHSVVLEIGPGMALKNMFLHLRDLVKKRMPLKIFPHYKGYLILLPRRVILVCKCEFLLKKLSKK